jgi:hypothetical protein
MVTAATCRERLGGAGLSGSLLECSGRKPRPLSRTLVSLRECKKSQRSTLQPQGVRDHRDGTKAHRRRGNHRAEQKAKERIQDARG